MFSYTGVEFRADFFLVFIKGGELYYAYGRELISKGVVCVHGDCL